MPEKYPSWKRNVFVPRSDGMYTPATSGTTATRATPVCPKCGGPSMRKTLAQRVCENCRTVFVIETEYTTTRSGVKNTKAALHWRVTGIVTDAPEVQKKRTPATIDVGNGNRLGGWIAFDNKARCSLFQIDENGCVLAWDGKRFTHDHKLSREQTGKLVRWADNGIKVIHDP